MKITYIHHSAFLVEMEHVNMIFDYTEGTVPELSKDRPLLVFASHRHGDHYNPVIFDWMERYPLVHYVLANDIWRKHLPEQAIFSTDTVKHSQTLTYPLEGGEAVITTYRSTDEGVAFWVEAEGKAVYHAGDLNNWTWNGEDAGWNERMAARYSREVDKMAGKRLDAAFLPLDPRQESAFYLGMDEFFSKVKVERAYPMHCWGDYTVIGRLKGMDCSEAYRDRIADIHGDGQVFEG